MFGGHGTINKLCILYLSLKRDTWLTPVAILRSHKTKCEIYYCVTTSRLNAVWWNVPKMSFFEKIDTEPSNGKMIDFDYYIYKIFQAKY